MAKTQLERLAVIEEQLQNNSKEHKQISDTISRIENKLDTNTEAIFATLERKADKDEFVFWRSILVSGILITIFIGVIAIYLNR
jgi:anti-sigma-K factor RskA